MKIKLNKSYSFINHDYLLLKLSSFIYWFTQFVFDTYNLAVLYNCKKIKLAMLDNSFKQLKELKYQLE